MSLIPSWGTDPTIGNRLINARAETIAEKPSFRTAFKQHFIRPRDGGLFALAGLWERWHDPQGETVETCTILTTEANELMRQLHDRMPVILDPASEGAWLDPHTSADALRALFVPYSSDRMEAFPVNPWVSNPKHEGARCLDPAGA